MATGITISIGHNSGEVDRFNEDAAWELLVGTVKTSIKFMGGEIKTHMGLDSFSDNGDPMVMIQGVLDSYSIEGAGNPMRIIDDEDGRRIYIGASGGGDYRIAKEIVMMEIARITMHTMTRCGIFINVVVG